MVECRIKKTGFASRCRQMSDVKILAVSYQKWQAFLVRLFLTDGKTWVLLIVAGSRGHSAHSRIRPKAWVWTPGFIHIVKKRYWCEKDVQMLSIRFRKKDQQTVYCDVFFCMLYQWLCGMLTEKPALGNCQGTSFWVQALLEINCFSAIWTTS